MEEQKVEENRKAQIEHFDSFKETEELKLSEFGDRNLLLVEEQEKKKKKKKLFRIPRIDYGKWIVGLGSIAGVCIFWVLETEITQGLQEPSDPLYYPKPVLLDIFVMSCYSFWLPIWLVWRLFEKLSSLNKEHVVPWISDDERNIIYSALLLTYVYFLHGVLWYWSLARTNATANTAVSDSEFAVVFVLSLFVLGELWSIATTCSVLLCLSGVLMVAIFSDEEQEEGVVQTWWGYAGVACATFLEGFFNVTYGYFSGCGAHGEDGGARNDTNDENRNPRAEIEMDEMNAAVVSPEKKGPPAEFVTSSAFLTSFRDGILFLWVMGLVSVCTLTPILAIANLKIFPYWDESESFHWTGDAAESFLSPSLPQVAVMAASALCDTATTICLLVGISTQSPLFMSAGGLMSIPTSAVADMIFHHYFVAPGAIGGIGCIIIGFVCLNFSQWMARNTEYVFHKLKLPNLLHNEEADEEYEVTWEDEISELPMQEMEEMQTMAKVGEEPIALTNGVDSIESNERKESIQHLNGEEIARTTSPSIPKVPPKPAAFKLILAWIIYVLFHGVMIPVFIRRVVDFVLAKVRPPAKPVNQEENPPSTQPN